jgi:protein-S-isoprenylcysteine O-methyltransferase Ste14
MAALIIFLPLAMAYLMAFEEQRLCRVFKEEFAAYRARVPLLLPLKRKR